MAASSTFKISDEVRDVLVERYLKLERLADADRTWMRVGGVAVRPGTEYLFGL